MFHPYRFGYIHVRKKRTKPRMDLPVPHSVGSDSAVTLAFTAPPERFFIYLF